MSFADTLLAQLIDVNCPNCDYSLEIQLVDVRTQTYRRCPCCRWLIRLQDGGGSTFGALKDIDNAFNNLEKTIRRIF